MESFFEFIFGNIFIVLIIIFAIINFLNKGKNAEEEEQRRPRPQPPQSSRTENRQESQTRPTMDSRVENDRSRSRADIESTIREASKTTEETVLTTIEEQRQEQYERLRSKLNTLPTTENNVQVEDMRFEITNQKMPTNEEEVPSVQMKLEDRLSSQGLIESVIMAEVLGPPRALNPYQNIVVKRRQKN